MAVTYVCPTCAARMSVDEEVENLRCPACRIAMLPQDQAGAGAPAGRVTAPAPVAPPFKGLKVARAVRAFGDTGVAPAVPMAGRTAPSAETQSVTVPSAPGGSLAQEMEKMVLTARRQAEKEAELVLETARLRAQQEGETYRRQLEEALQAEVVNLRAAQQQQAAQAAAALVQQAQQDAQREAEAVLAAARQQGEAVVAEARQTVIGEVQKLAKEARARADEIRAKAQDEVTALRTQALADAEGVKAEAAKLLEDTKRTLVEKAKEVAAGVRDRAQQEADALRRKAAEEAERVRLQAEELRQKAVAEAAQEAERLRAQASTELEQIRAQIAAAQIAAAQAAAATSAAPVTADSANGAAAPASGGDAAALGELQRQVRELEKEAERSRAAFEKRLKADAEAKETAFRDANGAHRVKFLISALLWVIGPMLLFYGLLVVFNTEGGKQILAGALLVVSFGLSVWGLSLGGRLKRHVDGLFEFFFREKLKAARSGEPGGPGEAVSETRTTAAPVRNSAAALAGVSSRRFGKGAATVRGKKAAAAAAPAPAAAAAVGPVSAAPAAAAAGPVSAAPAAADSPAPDAVAAAAAAQGAAAVGSQGPAPAAATAAAKPSDAAPG